mmetsp:Transcript_72578/g.125980  ORF Transcript_72578/g.125980 Transcript_72578/m.125980 type:complete len:276 (+) Transcript_72578:98-925(+)
MLGSGVGMDADKVDEEGREVYKLEGVVIPEWNTSYDSLNADSPAEKGVVQLFMKAAKFDDEALLKSLVLESHVNPNLRDRKGWTSLVRAAKCGSVKAVRFLCDAKADLNSQTKEKNSAVMKATKQGHLEIVQTLVAHQADVNIKNSGLATPLMMAVMKSQKRTETGMEFINILLRGKANVNEQKDTGYTSLMIAARAGQEQICHTLIEAMARLDQKDKAEETALQKAQKYNKQAAVKVIQTAGAQAAAAKKGPGGQALTNYGGKPFQPAPRRSRN